MWFYTTCQDLKGCNFCFIFFFSFFLSFVWPLRIHRRCMRSKRRSKRRSTTTLLRASPPASPPASVVLSVRRPLETTMNDDCVGELRLLRQKPIATHHRRRLSRSSPRLLRIEDSLRFVVNAAVVKTHIIKVSPFQGRFNNQNISASA